MLINTGASGIVVGGTLSLMTVTGIFHGQGSATAIDLGVGLDLDNLTVLGGAAGQGGIQFANINVRRASTCSQSRMVSSKSMITAGVSIGSLTTTERGR